MTDDRDADHPAPGPGERTAERGDGETRSGETGRAAQKNTEQRAQPSIPDPNTWTDEDERERTAGDPSRSDPTRTDSDGEADLTPEPGSTPVVAGHIDREHAAFVALGALSTVVVMLWTTGLGP